MAGAYDLIVIGAGPGGSAAAAAALRAGLRVVQLDRRPFPRAKPCGGGLTAKARAALGPGDAPAALATARAVAFGAWGRPATCFAHRAPLLTLVDRARFDHALVERNLRSPDFTFLEGERVLAVRYDGRFAVRTERRTLAGAQVVGADGAYSLVNRTFGVARPRAVATAVEVELGGAAVAAAPPPVARFDFGAVERGYGWVFPKGDRWNVGLYTFATGLRDLRGRLAAYLRAAGFAVRGDPLATFAAHRIPVGGYRLAAPGAPLYVVGDAAGLADALTGEGLYHALASGRLAGATAGAVAAGRAAPGAYYARLWRAVLPDTWLSYRLAGAVYRHPAAAMGLLASPAVGRPLVEGAAAGATFAQSVARAGPYLARSLRAGALARQRLAPAGRAR